MKIQVYSALVLCLGCLALTGCNNTVESNSQSTSLSLDEKYSDISKHLIELDTIAKNNFQDIISISQGVHPENANFKYSDETFSPTPVIVETDLSQVLSSYSGYDWVNNRGIIILKLSNDDETHIRFITATFDSNDVLISTKVGDDQVIAFDEAPPVEAIDDNDFIFPSESELEEPIKSVDSTTSVSDEETPVASQGIMVSEEANPENNEVTTGVDEGTKEADNA